MNFYTLYRAHNYHFKIYGAMFAGQPAGRAGGRRRAAASIPEELLRVEVPADGRLAGGLRADAAARPDPLRQVAGAHRARRCRTTSELYCVTTAMTHYAQGRRARRHRPGARRPSASASSSRPRVERGARDALLFNNTCARHPRRRRRDARRRARVPQGRLRRRLRPPAARDRARRRPALRRALGLDAADRATPTARCCSSRATSRRPRPSTAPTSAWTTRSPAPASTPTTSGACTATTSAWTASARTSAPASSSSARPRGRPRRRPDHRVLLLSHDRPPSLLLTKPVVSMMVSSVGAVDALQTNATFARPRPRNPLPSSVIHGNRRAFTRIKALVPENAADSRRFCDPIQKRETPALAGVP